MDALAEALRREHTVSQVDDPKEANVVQSNDKPYGKKLCYVLQIPYGPVHPGSRFVHGQFRETRHDVNRLLLLRDARGSDMVLVYSEFVRDVLKKYHGINATVLYPPVEDMASDTVKKKVILSVGRFFGKRIYNHKRYEDLLEAFKQFHYENPDWVYRIVGGAEETEGDYVWELIRQAAGYPIFFQTNVKPDKLREYYGEATLYWHAAGFEAKGPEEMEAFGISLVEAMSAGCIPLAFANGGPMEILSYQHAGEIWESIEQLVKESCEWADPNPLYYKIIQRDLRKRFTDFTCARFNERALSIFRGVA